VRYLSVLRNPWSSSEAYPLGGEGSRHRRTCALVATKDDSIARDLDPQKSRLEGHRSANNVRTIILSNKRQLLGTYRHTEGCTAILGKVMI
jgi:hypothetical protein